MSITKIKFSDNIAKGSVSKRLNTAENINHVIFNNILKLYDNTNCVPLRQIEKVYKASLPETLYVSIKKLTPNEKKSVGGLLSTFFKDESVLRYKMSLPADGNMLKLSDLPTLMHESAHLLDHAINPKKNICSVKVISVRGISESIDKFYSSEIYNTALLEKCSYLDIIKMKASLRNLLRGFTNCDKILLINYIREALSGEVFAFSEEHKYINFLQNDPNHYCLIKRNPIKAMEKYMFKEKMEMLKNMAFDIISLERGK